MKTNVFGGCLKTTSKPRLVIAYDRSNPTRKGDELPGKQRKSSLTFQKDAALVGQGERAEQGKGDDELKGPTVLGGILQCCDADVATKSDQWSDWAAEDLLTG